MFKHNHASWMQRFPRQMNTESPQGSWNRGQGAEEGDEVNRRSSRKDAGFG